MIYQVEYGKMASSDLSQQLNKIIFCEKRREIRELVYLDHEVLVQDIAHTMQSGWYSIGIPTQERQIHKAQQVLAK